MQSAFLATSPHVPAALPRHHLPAAASITVQAEALSSTAAVGGAAQPQGAFHVAWGTAGAAVAASAVAAGAQRWGRQSRKRHACRRSLIALGAEIQEIDLGAPFPFSAVVGQDEMKLALILNMIDPSIGGCLIQGERGTGKSTVVRSLTRLLPEIPCIADDKYNSDPNDPSAMSEEGRARLRAGETLPIVMRPTPFVELPLGATEDRVTGTIDIERALMEGGKAFEPGILARVNRGVLYIDEVNLLDDQLVDVLLDSAAGGWNTVEREGISIRHPARFVLIGTAHPDEGDLRPQLLDRFGCTVSVRTANDAESRAQVCNRSGQWANKRAGMEARFGKEDEVLKKTILEARDRLKETLVPRNLQVNISTICSRLNIDGMRGDIVTNRAARALASYEGRTEVTKDDIKRVGVFCLQHRLRKNVVSDGADNTGRVLEALRQELGGAKKKTEFVLEEK